MWESAQKADIKVSNTLLTVSSDFTNINVGVSNRRSCMTYVTSEYLIPHKTLICLQVSVTGSLLLYALIFALFGMQKVGLLFCLMACIYLGVLEVVKIASRRHILA